MQDLKEVFVRIDEQKKEARRLKQLITDALKGSREWNDKTDEMKTLKAKRRLVEDAVLSGYQKEIEDLDNLKRSIREDQTLLSDIAMTMLMKGETVKLETEQGEWEPTIKVSFKQLSLF